VRSGARTTLKCVGWGGTGPERKRGALFLSCSLLFWF